MPKSLFNKAGGCKPATLLKRDSGASNFLTILLDFLEHLFLKNTCGLLLLSVDFLTISKGRVFSSFLISFRSTMWGIPFQDSVFFVM